MELFDKFYNCYYEVVRRILWEASLHPITRRQMEDICSKYGTGESAYTILPKLLNGDWMLLSSGDGKSFLPRVVPGKLPLTDLQRSWLKALLNDNRIRCFLTEDEFYAARQELQDVEPLYNQKDFHYFDQCLDGDEYSSKSYQENFHTILTALKQKQALIIAYRGKQGNTITFEAAPYQLQYSSKDDKFRLCCLKERSGRFSLNTTLNLNRIEACHLSRRKSPSFAEKLRFSHVQKSAEPVLLEISGERNSLERCMLHFANYEKHTEYDEEHGVYLCSIYYDLADETELLIDILSFGPVIRVLGPENFLEQIRKRVRRQHELFYDRTD